jgi:hypothetical protein
MFGKIKAFLPNIGKIHPARGKRFCQSLANSPPFCQTLAKRENRAIHCDRRNPVEVGW